MGNYLDRNARDSVDTCNICAIECARCFSNMVGKESKNVCPACCMSVRISAACAPMQSPATARSPSSLASYARKFVTGVQPNAMRMLWITASAAPRRAGVAPRLVEKWSAKSVTI